MNTRILIVAALLAASLPSARAGRNLLKPSDFHPLTALPWKEPGATLDTVLEAIFREPDYTIRSAVLREYLRQMPIPKMGKAFDLSLVLEGAQTPHSLVELFLRIWAKRDPQACWKHTQELFRLVGIEGGWLSYDSWANERITVVDRAAIQRSHFWIETRDVLTAFPVGVEESSLPGKEKVRLMRMFAELWFNTFQTWPRSGYNLNINDWRDRQVMEIFALSNDELKSDSFFDSALMQQSNENAEVLFEIGVRRRLQEMPEDALEIIKTVRAKKWPSRSGEREERMGEPSRALLTIWADVDFSTMRKWAESLDPRKDDVGVTARGLLLSRIDQDGRERWLKHAEPVNEEDSYFVSLLGEWARWDPKAALDAAIASKNNKGILEAINGAVGGPWGGESINTIGFGIDIVKDLDLSILPDDARQQLMQGSWNQDVLEWYGTVDIPAMARHGFDFMRRTNFTPRENLIKFFSGQDGYTDDDVIDRTFCSLRVWAVVKPKEMKAWIGTIKEADMRKALTWLLEHPWGTGPKK